ncbi:hypothetical protein AOLI_G00055850 [Acnodon oligacanthus]
MNQATDVAVSGSAFCMPCEPEDQSRLQERESLSHFQVPHATVTVLLRLEALEVPRLCSVVWSRCSAVGVECGSESPHAVKSSCSLAFPFAGCWQAREVVFHLVPSSLALLRPTRDAVRAALMKTQRFDCIALTL